MCPFFPSFSSIVLILIYLQVYWFIPSNIYSSGGLNSQLCGRTQDQESDPSTNWGTKVPMIFFLLLIFFLIYLFNILFFFINIFSFIKFIHGFFKNFRYSTILSSFYVSVLLLRFCIIPFISSMFSFTSSNIVENNYFGVTG